MVDLKSVHILFALAGLLRASIALAIFFATIALDLVVSEDEGQSLEDSDKVDE